jgi:hypothetical protein
MYAALSDSLKIAKKYSEIGGEHRQEEYLVNVYSKTRTTDQVSYTQKNIGEKAFELRSKNPFPGIFGSMGGAFKGFTYSMGNYLPAVVFSTIALVSKKWPAKIGAAGVAAGIIYKIVRQGFGVGKQNPMT